MRSYSNFNQDNIYFYLITKSLNGVQFYSEVKEM